MNWIERYVAQVKCYLPRSDRQDVAEELNSLLEEKATERRDALGHELTEEETFALLKEVGHPLVIASSYTNTGPLVSESLLPLYWLVVRYMAIILLAIYVASIGWYYLMGDRLPWPATNIHDLVNIGMFYFAAITLTFYFAGHYLQTLDFFKNWKPAQLPAAGLERESLFSSVFIVIFMLAWFRLLSAIPVEHNTEVLLGQTGDWLATFILWLKFQVLISLPVYVWLLFRSYWSVTRRLVIILADLSVITGGLIAFSIADQPSGLIEGAKGADWELPIFPFSSLVLGLWVSALTADIVLQGYKIWRGLTAN